MKKKKRYYKNLDILRVVACIAILFYHLNILKGGYLAVCVFFCLSGYLSWTSASNQKVFSYKEYYKNHFFKLYIPLFITIFLTLGILSFLPNLVWLNLKPETLSVLFGYNNFWQLSVNADYFARALSSPFTHLWYMAILLQFDLIFPFLYSFFSKKRKKKRKWIPCILSLFLSLLSIIFFFLFLYTKGRMEAYYHTFARVFSLLLGMSLGICQTNYKSSPKIKAKEKIIMGSYFIILILLFIFANAKSKFFGFDMLITSLITVRFIDYATIKPTNKRKKQSLLDKIIKNISSISYEMYLVQYPIIYLCSAYISSKFLDSLTTIILTFIISYLLSLLLKKKEKTSYLKKIGILGISLLSLIGIIFFIKTKDHTSEMKALEELLNQNEMMMTKKQEEYQKMMNEQKEAWQDILNDLEKGEEKITEMVENLSVVGIGDSIMLGATPSLYNKFKNGYFDAKVSRSVWAANSVIKDLKDKNMLSDVVILNLGANGDCSLSCKQTIMNSLESREVFWLNVTNDYEVHFNDNLKSFASNYSNLHIIDWNQISKNHNDYFYSDHIHLNNKGQEAYTKAIYDAIYQFYLTKYQEEKNVIIKNYEEELKNKITFYGNDLLLNAYEQLSTSFADAKFVIKKDFNDHNLLELLKEEQKTNTLNHRLVFAFDSNTIIKKETYEEIIKLCKTNEIYILFINNDYDLSEYSAKIIPFHQQLKDEYFLADKIHLNKEGNQVLINILTETLKK